MPGPGTRDLVEQHRRRLYTYLQALLPGAPPVAAFREAVTRLDQLPDPPAGEDFARRADAAARQVADEHRKARAPLPFSDDLYRQVAESAGPVLDRVDRRPAALKEILHQLPPPEQQLLRERYSAGRSVGEIAGVTGRSAHDVARDLAGLHASLAAAMAEAVPDTGPPPPGGAADLGRLAVQLLDGTITEDARLVLETLLLGDAAAQAQYHRTAALVVDLDWAFGWPPALPDPPAPAPSARVSRREWVVTALFVAAVLAVLAFAVLRLFGYP